MSDLRLKLRSKLEALKAKGLASTVSVVSQSSAFDPSTQSATITERSQNATAVFKNVVVASLDGSVRTIKREFIIAGASLTTAPVAGDVIRHKGIDYKIVEVIETAPAGIALVYNIEVAD